jgi:lipoprotein-anchoring transpeptidase ErfK/SrfK
MVHAAQSFIKLTYIAVIAALVTGILPAGSAAALVQAPGRAEVGEAQDIMNTFAIPNGPRDGLNGPNTGQGLCIFRTISGLTPSRKNLDTETLAQLRNYKAKYGTGTGTQHGRLPAPYLEGKSTYLYASQACQALVYVINLKYWIFFPASTGSTATQTPNGSYTLGDTVRGWTCSTIYTETCKTQTAGQYASYRAANGTVRNYGNMYNKRAFKNEGFYIHGSNNVPTTPGSGGCIRVSVDNADWISRFVPTGTPLFVAGAYSQADRAAAPTTAATTAPRTSTLRK